MKRYKMSRKNSKRKFRRGTAVKKSNLRVRLMRGGTRL